MATTRCRIQFVWIQNSIEDHNTAVGAKHLGSSWLRWFHRPPFGAMDVPVAATNSQGSIKTSKSSKSRRTTKQAPWRRLKKSWILSGGHCNHFSVYIKTSQKLQNYIYLKILEVSERISWSSEVRVTANFIQSTESNDEENGTYAAKLKRFMNSLHLGVAMPQVLVTLLSLSILFFVTVIFGLKPSYPKSDIPSWVHEKHFFL